MKANPSFWMLAAAFIMLAAGAQGQVPQVINYQAQLTDASNNPLTGSHTIVFRLYDKPTTGDLLWEETHTVTMTNGFLNVLLGDGTPPNPIPLNLFDFGVEMYLELTVDGIVSAPRQRLGSVPYAFRSQATGGGGNTLDQAYDQGGPGAGRTITADAGAVNIAGPGGLTVNGDVGIGTITPQAKLDVINSNGNFGLLGWIGAGVLGLNASGTNGSLGDSKGVSGAHVSGNHGYLGSDNEGAVGVHANGNYGFLGTNLDGVVGFSSSSGGFGATGSSSNNNFGILGSDFYGVRGSSPMSDGYGVFGTNSFNGSTGYLGSDFAGVVGTTSSSNAYGVIGESAGSGGIGVLGRQTAAASWAGYFHGDVHITGILNGPSSSLKIDHPLDPENKYLSHSSVQSPDMKNVYDGIATLDTKGEAEVQLPAYFQAINNEYRYQLTCIGGYAPVYIAEKIANNRFKIAGGTPGLEVSWQVTGVRQDAFAQAHRMQVEAEKTGRERGKYLYPKEHGMPESIGIEYERLQQMDQKRQAHVERMKTEQEQMKAREEQHRLEREKIKASEEQRRLEIQKLNAMEQRQ